MKTVGFIGWRGMVGSVLMERMCEENDFQGYKPIFFTTSQVGQPAPAIGMELPPLADAYDTAQLMELDIIVTCQGGGYTEKVYPDLRQKGWQGYWIDAASTLRMKEDSIIVLDPVNRDVIDKGLEAGVKTFAGGNCTVSLMLMALGGLFKEGLIEWLSSMTYQAASGAGAKNMRELVKQMEVVADSARELTEDSASSILELDKRVATTIASDAFPVEQFGAPLAGSLIPWIDCLMEGGETREEWKGFAETNKILEAKTPIAVDGICVRIGAMRCHSQAFTVKLKKDLSLEEIEQKIAASSDWTELVPNTKEETLKKLTPAVVTGTLKIPVGRVRKMNIGPEYFTCFSVGDQLLWGAAEPVRRMLKIVLER